MYRQGDVLIERIDEIPTTKDCTDRLLVRGEGRNHAHYIMGEGVSIGIPEDTENTSEREMVTHYLSITEEARLEHLLIDSEMWTEEHDTIRIPPGTYKVIRQREYDPYARAIRMVKD